MNDTVSDGAVTHFSQTVVQDYHVCKETIKEGPHKPKCQQTTVKARTIDGVTKTTIYMAPPSGTPKRDLLNPRTREQKRCVPSRL